MDLETIERRLKAISKNLNTVRLLIRTATADDPNADLDAVSADLCARLMDDAQGMLQETERPAGESGQLATAWTKHGEYCSAELADYRATVQLQASGQLPASGIWRLRIHKDYVMWYEGFYRKATDACEYAEQWVARVTRAKSKNC